MGKGFFAVSMYKTFLIWHMVYITGTIGKGSIRTWEDS
ncbi:hypothetical protein EH11_02029 [Bacillus subtilis]|nr:Hypothetical Protein U712_11440 [Bacillus subtilis PY79]AKN14356.1 hypothetical protein ABU16_3280 [Bacillus subtilis]EME05995.1 hypothetical protein BS732_2869 [Bacillus subtilis MB73/2]CCU58859.1 hypothetical protein BSUBE1_2228 [Bacillus subtilis E1]BAI85858.1 hypothetical protein BSNT_08773 [Bacillus subtilis subsp. natto BEST195]